MKGENLLYEYLYQSILNQIYISELQIGDKLPSQQEICRQYNVGITTVRRVFRMLQQDGVISCSARSRAVVLYTAEDREAAMILAQKKNMILDSFRSLAPILPTLQARGLMLTENLELLQKKVDSLNESMSHQKILQQVSDLFLDLLKPLNNPVLCDFQTDITHCTYVPQLSFLSLESRYDLTLKKIKCQYLQVLNAASSCQAELTEDLLKQLYYESWNRAEKILKLLKKQSQGRRSDRVFAWVAVKNRAHLYAVIARRLYRRILSGEFDGQPYIPSVPELMREYSVSQATALSAVGLLNDIGIVQTYDKKGTIINSGEPVLQPLRLEPQIIKENLCYFLDALQILALCIKNVTYSIFINLKPKALHALAFDWRARREQLLNNQLFSEILDQLRLHAPYQTLSIVFEQLDDLLLWGCYLLRGRSLQPVQPMIEHHFEQLLKALEKADVQQLAEEIEDLFVNGYDISRNYALEHGIEPALLPSVLSAPQSEKKHRFTNEKNWL